MEVEQLTFTDLPRGKGVDPEHAGYQVKACSPGLRPDEQTKLADLCMHYGDSVYRCAPRSALDSELAWRSSAESVDSVPVEILSQFPHIWSYHCLSENRFALTRIGYCGITHDGRFGNFFAHSLVFAPGDLRLHRDNALRFARSGMFRVKDPSEGIRLPVVSGMGEDALNASGAVLGRPPYRDSIAALLSALANREQLHRPVLICLADWREATPLLEAVLDLLPPTARRRTTLCTYETDRNWSPRSGDRSLLSHAHDLMVLYGADEQAFDLRADDYESRFAVFNFVARRFSPLGPMRRFADFAAACTLEGEVAALGNLHEIIEELDAGTQPDAWDLLTPAAQLHRKHLAAPAMTEAARCLAERATNPAHAQAARRRLWPHVQALAESNDVALLARLAPHVAALADRDGREDQSLVSELANLASATLAKGCAGAAAELLYSAGRSRRRILDSVLAKWLAAEASREVPAQGDDRSALVELLIEGLPSLNPSCDLNSPYVLALAAALNTASRQGTAGEVWKRIGDDVRKQALSGPWNAAQLAFAQKISACLPADQCPQANAWIHESLLESGDLQGDALLAALEGAARASGSCDHADARVQRLAALAERKLPDKPALAVGLGRMAEAAVGTAVGQAWYARYRAAVQELSSNHLRSIHAALANAGAERVLCRDLFDALVPWQAELSPNRFQHWKEVLAGRAAILDCIGAEATSRLQDLASAEPVLPLVRELAALQNQMSETGRAAFLECLVLTLPLRPLDDHKLEASLESAAKALPPAPRARLQVLKFLAQVEQQTRSDRWTTASFPAKDEVWTRDVRALSAPDKQQLRQWCLRVAAIEGIASPQDASMLATMLAPLDAAAPSALAEAVVQLLKDRDLVTVVVCLKAFVRCFWGRPADWRDLIRALAERCDKKEISLLLDHMERGVGRRGADFDHNLRRLKELVGLAEPQSEARQQQGPSPTPSGLTSLLRSAQRLIFGGGQVDGDAHDKPHAPAEQEPTRPKNRKKRKH